MGQTTRGADETVHVDVPREGIGVDEMPPSAGRVADGIAGEGRRLGRDRDEH